MQNTNFLVLLVAAQLSWTNQEAMSFLGAMLEVATVRDSEKLESISGEMISAVQSHILKTSIDLSSLQGVKPDACALTITNSDKREQLLQILILLPYIDMKVDPAMIQLVDSFAAALDFNSNTLKDLHRVRDNKMNILLIDYGRRGVEQVLGIDTAPKALKAVIKIIHEATGDPILASKFQGLERYPVDSLGHSVYHWYRDRKWPLPGEKKCTPDLLLTHDCCHILSGCNTDFRGEMDVSGFQAGMLSDEDMGFEQLLEVILDFHLGKKFTTVGDIVPPKTGNFEPEEVLTSYERGVSCNINLFEDWEFWDVAEQPVVELRKRYGIPEISGPILLKP